MRGKRGAAWLLSAAFLLTAAGCAGEKKETDSREVGESVGETVHIQPGTAGQAGETAGAGREEGMETAGDKPGGNGAAEETGKGETGGNGTGKPDSTTGVGGEPSYTVKDGKYVYTIPKPDRSGLSDLSAIEAMGHVRFNDVAADGANSWYCGKVERNLDTGEVTYVWDRTKETLATIEQYGGIYRRHTDEKVVYFTFDCGYENGWTDPILDVLKEKNVPGLFFLVGHYVDTADAQIRRMLDEGHLIGNHTVNHPDMATVSAQTFIEEIEGLEKKIAEKFPDAPPLRYYRPPEGSCDGYSLALAQKMGYHTVLWSWGHYDWVENDQPDPASALLKAKTGLHPGAVYLFHCVGSTNPAILGDLIDYIRAEGYEIRPICD